jgi:hypothetical protein
MRLLLPFALVCAASAETVTVDVFSLFRPAAFDLKAAPGATVRVAAGGEEKTLEGARTLRLTHAARMTAPADFVLSVPGRISRRFSGRLEILPGGSALRAIVTMDLEVAVASILAAESGAAPPEAQKVQAVVTRSFLRGMPPRHGAARFCDTTHCQFLRDVPRAGSPAAAAAAATEGAVLTFLGVPVPALYSARCGGRTRSLAAAGWGRANYPFFGVTCGFCRGPARGHSLGLCQEGASGMARAGKTFIEILRHYFPGTEIDPFPTSQTWAAKSRSVRNPIER